MNYQKLFKEFLLSGKTTASDRRKFVATHGINDNTFRSKLVQWRKTTAFENWNAQQSDHRLLKKSIEQSRHTPKKAKQIKNNRGTVSENRDDRGRFIVGNTASQLHGKYKKAYKERMFDSDEEEMLASCSLNDHVRVMQNQLNILNEISSRQLRKIQEADDRDEKIIIKGKELTVFDAVQFVTEQTATISVPMLARITATQKSISDMELNVIKTQKALMEIDTITAKRPVLDMSEQTELVIKLVKESEEKKLDARSTCLLFLKNGLTQPAYFSKLAEIEAKNAEDEIDNDEGLSDAEVEEVRARSLERRALSSQRMENIRKRNAKIYAAAQDLGREKITMSESNDD